MSIMSVMSVRCENQWWCVFLMLLALGLGAASPQGSECDLQCRGVGMVDAFLDRAARHAQVDLMEGVRFVKTMDQEGLTGRSIASSFIARLKRFLASYELQVKLPEMLPRSKEVQGALHTALDYLNQLQTDEETSRKGGGGGLGGGKKGGGAILMMATMMGGTMAALGFGAVGMLAMKALTVSAMALMLSAVIGLKKLLSKGDDDGGHSVSYIPVHHGGGHRRRRSISHLPFRAHVPKR